MKRRQVMIGSATLLALPALAQQRRALAQMTDGPFYPPKAWRERWPDQDADLTRVGSGTPLRSALGEHLGLDLVLADTQGRLIDGAEIEIWQCDLKQAYRHPSVAATPGSFDEAFQGFGATRSGAQGEARFRSIKPVPYPGRTPHIHFKLRHASFGEFTSQLFLAGDAGNARDFLWRSLSAQDRAALELKLQPVDGADTGLRWMARQVLVVPA